MAFVDFYRQSNLFNLQPRDPNLPSGFLKGPATRFVNDGDPADHLEKHSVFVDIQDFAKSVLHVPADWKARWEPAIHTVKRNPDFMNHYLEYRARHEKEYAQPEERHYEPLLLMNDAILRVAFPTISSRDTTSAPFPLTQFIHIVDDGSSYPVLNDGSSIPRLVTESMSREFSTFPSN